MSHDDTLVTEVQEPLADAPADGPVTLDRDSVVDALLDEGSVVARAAGDRYAVEAEIAAGAMGRVLLARDRDINRPVAVKVMRASRASPRARRRFVDEVRLAGQLTHPNIVPIHDVGLSEDGTGWYTMRFVEGETLASLIARLRAGDAMAHAQYTIPRRMKLFLDVCDGLAYAHARGVIHRDLKPANLLVGNFGEALVTDWGIAKRLGGFELPVSTALDADDPTATHDGSVLGTPAYMSPEQARGDNKSVDQRSDVYSLCAILFELLSLEFYLHPLTAHADKAVLLKAVQETVPWLPSTTRNPNQRYRVPVDLSRIVVRGLAKDPAHRFQSVAELRDAILRIDDGLTRVQCPTTAALRVIGGARRLLSIAPVFGFIALFAAGSLMVWGAVDLALRLLR